MQVIRHQAITNQPHSMEFDVLAQKIEIHHAVCIAIQDKSPRISALCYVVRNIHGDDSSQTCHNENLAAHRIAFVERCTQSFCAMSIPLKTENQFKSKTLRSIGVRASVPVTTHRPRHLPSHDLEDRVSRRDQQYVSYKDCCEIFPCSLFLASEKT
jgi:hypothetical protein